MTLDDAPGATRDLGCPLPGFGGGWIEDGEVVNGAGTTDLVVVVQHHDGHRSRAGYSFTRAMAHRYFAESLSTLWMLDAYDKLVEFEDSSWARDLYERRKAGGWGDEPLMHVGVYVADDGFYDFACMGWEVLPEVQLGPDDQPISDES